MKVPILILGMVWPEPETTAAGTRMLQLIDYFRLRNYRIVFASTASKGENSYSLENLGVESQEILLNDSGFDVFIEALQPEIVVFDRFVTEEQFGWRVRQICPYAMRILDTEDLHLLRYSRELAMKNERRDFHHFLDHDISYRELASIYRSDLSLIISEWEHEFLTSHFRVPSSLLFYLPFLPEPLTEAAFLNNPPYEERMGFMFMGNMRHGPNLDAVHYLRKEIWPRIREQLPSAEMHVYGAYTPKGLGGRQDTQQAFRVRGMALDKKEVYSRHRVCLAPLRYGAGLKGKLFDAMQFGIPCVTTGIGAEGINGKLPWNGYITDDPETFAFQSAALYNDKKEWIAAREKGWLILEQRFDREAFQIRFTECLNALLAALPKHRKNNFYGNMLWHHSLMSTRYLSKWIEAKNRFKTKENDTAEVPSHKAKADLPEGSGGQEP